MTNVFIMLAQGFEIAEAIVPLDMIRRAGLKASLVSVTGQLTVTASNGVKVIADELVEDIHFNDGKMIFLPGGMPGSIGLSKCQALQEAIQMYIQTDKYVAAICAAPLVLGRMGLLKGKKATCYPGFEQELDGAEHVKETCVHDGQIITACGPGAVFEIGSEIVSTLLDPASTASLLRQMMYHVYQ